MKSNDYNKILEGIRENLKNYIIKYNLKSLVLGVSGGIDSTLVAVIAKPVCDELKIPLIGVWIEIKGNKLSEKERALKVGNEFCTYFQKVNLTSEYNKQLKKMKNPQDNFSISDFFKIDISENEYEEKVRLGNIKARMRMIYLYNLSQRYKGVTLNTDNQTEYQLGFWTIHGDDFDIDLLKNLWKTEIYELSNYVLSTLKTAKQKETLQICIDAVPTDGLGITNSDFEQFGCNNYNEVDKILKSLYLEFYTCCTEKQSLKNIEYTKNVLYEKYGKEKVDKIWDRHIKSAFKRKHPIDLTSPKF